MPHVQVAASAFGAITRAAERQTGTVPLQLGISVTPTNQVTALVQELDPLGECAAVHGVRVPGSLGSTKNGFVEDLVHHQQLGTTPAPVWLCELYVECTPAKLHPNCARTASPSLLHSIVTPTQQYYSKPTQPIFIPAVQSARLAPTCS